MEPSKLINYYLISISFTYLWAFSSLYYQIPGLYGDHGLTPARANLKCEFENSTKCAFDGEHPTLLHLFVDWYPFRLSPSVAMEFACILGIGLSIITAVFRSFRDCTVYGIIWYLYFSCFQVGQTFLWFQWDTLLLETGFLTALLAPSRMFRRLFFGSKFVDWLPCDNVGLFLIRWLAFRLMFASGVVKLTSECPTWWGLTALHHHFESQCIPTWAAWYAHNFSPDWFKKLSVVGTYVIEILVPAAFFLIPVRKLRQIAFWSQVILMVNIKITGNYNFFNAITIFVCSSLLVEMDGYSNFGTHNIKSIIGRRLYSILKCASIVIGLAYLTHWSIELFGLRLETKNGDYRIESEITMSRSEYDAILGWASSKLLIVGGVVFASEVGAAMIRSFTDIVDCRGARGLAKRTSVFLHCCVVCAVAATMFAISLVPISWVHREAHGKLWPELKALQRKTDKFQLMHGYGLFRSMTGVGGRPEVVVEGAESIDGPWMEYEFMYKPTALDRKPPFIAPHQARLDWQMWFAALDTFQRNPWFTCMMYRLLKHEPDVLKLMDVQNPNLRRVKYVRAKLYHYHFTTAEKGDLNFSSRNWWWREFKYDYFPEFSLEKTEWIDWLKESGCIVQKSQKRRRYGLDNALVILRDLVDLFGRAEYFVWTLTLFVVALILIKSILFSRTHSERKMKIE